MEFSDDAESAAALETAGAVFGGAEAALYSGFGVMGYRFLPPTSFGPTGELLWPSGLPVAPGWDQAIGRVTRSPEWGELFSILGVLMAPGTAWSCWRVALSFHRGIIRVLIVRGGSMTNGQQVSVNWSNNLWLTVLSKLKTYAGRRLVIPAPVAEAITSVAGGVRELPYWTQYENLPDGKEGPDPRKVQRAALKFRTFQALGIIEMFAKLIASATVSGKVLSTVMWFDPQRGSLPTAQIAWPPLHILYDQWQSRAIHYWWNSACRTSPGKFASYPVVRGQQQLSGIGVTDVAHANWDIAGAMYPDGNWPPPTLTESNFLEQAPGHAEIASEEIDFVEMDDRYLGGDAEPAT